MNQSCSTQLFQTGPNLPRHCGVLNTLWIGKSLGAIEKACLKSALKQGHELNLYCYEEPDGVPAGVRLQNAADVLPRARLMAHESGSVALFSDLFRYELQRQGRGVWVDTDVYFIRPLDCTVPYIYGYQSIGVINGAVLKLPADAPLLEALIRIFDEREAPYWLRPDDFAAAASRLRTTGRTHVSQMPWGTAGPNALSALVKSFGLEGHALGTEVFYPVYYKHAAWICDPAHALFDMISPQTVAIHLWNELIKDYKHRPAPAGSFLARLQAEGA